MHLYHLDRAPGHPAGSLFTAAKNPATQDVGLTLLSAPQSGRGHVPFSCSLRPCSCRLVCAFSLKAGALYFSLVFVGEWGKEGQEEGRGGQYVFSFPVSCKRIYILSCGARSGVAHLIHVYDPYLTLTLADPSPSSLALPSSPLWCSPPLPFT